MRMKTVVNLKDGTVYKDRDFDKEKVAVLVEKLGKLIDNDSIESIFVTKYIYTKEIKEKYFDAFEEAVESIRTFFSKESCESTAKEAENFFGTEMLKIKLKEEEEGRMRDRQWLGMRIDRLDYALEEKEKELSANTEELNKMTCELESVAKEKENLLELIRKLNDRIVVMTNENREILNTSNRISEDNYRLKAEIEKNYKDLLEQRETIDRLNDSLDDEKRLMLIIEEQDSKLKEFTHKMAELIEEKNIIKSSVVKVLEVYKKKEESLTTKIQELNEYCKNMETQYISKSARQQKLFDQNWNALLSELNSLKKRTLWQRIRNKH